MMMKKSKLRRAMVWLWVIVIVAGGLVVWKMAPSISSSMNSSGDTGTEAVGQKGGASGKSLQGSTLPTGGPKGNPQATSDVQ